MHESKKSVIGLIDNSNLEDHYLSNKNLHLNNESNGAFAKMFYILLKVELQILILLMRLE